MSKSIIKFESLPKLAGRKSVDVLVLPFWEDSKAAQPAATLPADVSKEISGPINLHDFSGKDGEVFFLYGEHLPAKRIALLGLGKSTKVTVESLRQAYAHLVKACRKHKITEVALVVPDVPPATREGTLRGVTEGLLLANYVFEDLKRHALADTGPTQLLTKAIFLGLSKAELALIQKYAAVAEGVYLARDLVNSNADDVNPQHLAKLAKEFGATLPHLKVTIFEKARIEKEGMGLLLAVNRGAAHDPAFIIMEYKGAPQSKERTVLVGKGVTYDTGGLNLKPTGSMETMKCDMGGAAMSFGTLLAAAKLGLKINLTVVVPATENAIGPKSYKPGDVYFSYSGKSVEISNTDAEGRLILADAMAYAIEHYSPTRLITFATLTGAIDVALGNDITGIFATQDALADSMINAGHATYERLWRLPLCTEYREQLKSDVADIKNAGSRSGGSITAALFLKEFAGDTPWAHCDIASTAFLSEGRRYLPKHATGVGVRLMVEFLESL